MQKEGGAGKNKAPPTCPAPQPKPRPLDRGGPPSPIRLKDWTISVFKASYDIFYGNKQPCRFRVIVKCLTLKEICRLF